MQRDPDAEEVELFLFVSLTSYDEDGKVAAKAKARAVKGSLLRLSLAAAPNFFGPSPRTIRVVAAAAPPRPRLRGRPDAGPRYFAEDVRGPAARFVVDGPFSLPVYDYPEPQDPERHARRTLPPGIEAVAGDVHAKAVKEVRPDPALEETHPQSCERYKDSALAKGAAPRVFFPFSRSRVVPAESPRGTPSVPAEYPRGTPSVPAEYPRGTPTPRAVSAESPRGTPRRRRDPSPRNIPAIIIRRRKSRRTDVAQATRGRRRCTRPTTRRTTSWSRPRTTRSGSSRSGWRGQGTWRSRSTSGRRARRPRCSEASTSATFIIARTRAWTASCASRKKRWKVDSTGPRASGPSTSSTRARSTASWTRARPSS